MNIAVDMTPYIAGGANGGLVPLLISTIREMVARNEDDITLITTVQNYTDLAFMDGPRVSRCTIDGSRKSWEEEPSMTDEQTAAPLDWTRRVFHKVQAPAKRFLPCRTYNYLKNHKRFFVRAANAVTHPWLHFTKPILRWVMPHGLYERHLEKIRQKTIEAEQEKQAADTTQQEYGKVHDNSELKRITGKEIDVFYCPFTAVPLVDECVPVVSVLHDIQHKFFPWFFPQEELMVRDQFYENLIRLHPQIMAVSEFTKQTFIDIYHYDQDKIIAIPSSVQNRLGGFPASEDEQQLNKFSLKKGSFIFFPANFWPHKNHRALFTAFNMFHHKRPEYDLKLVLSGFSGDGNQAWRDAVKAMGLENEIMFLGYVSDAELAALLRNCRFMVFPSLFEGFGMPITEAMSMGTTVLCSNVTSLPEVGGDCAFYFNPYDPADICKEMEYVLDHPEEAEKKKQKYKEHLARFSTDAYIEKIRALFIQLIREAA